MDRAALTEKHSVVSEGIFRLKSLVHTAHRYLQNTFLYREQRFHDTQTLLDAPIIARSESSLWNKHDNEHNWILTAGKVQNLRVAVKKFNNIEVPANSVFSFWAQLGNPTESRGYVEGREIREGCLVATVAGGLCQLSNGLYDAALKAGFDIVERHKHTQVIQGSLAEQDRDATVKWNYVDLRFKSKYAFRIEAELTNDNLIVSFRSPARNDGQESKPINIPSSKLNDCFSCGNTACFKHPGKTIRVKGGTVTTFILDEKWPEYEAYVEKLATENDYFLVPLLNSDKKKYQWKLKNPKHAHDAKMVVYRRALATRWSARRNGKIPPLLLRYDNKIALSLAKHIPVESTHIVVSQNLLPFIWAEGALGGRTYDVLMTRLPIERLQQRLDEAHKKYPVSKTLNDFRASQQLIDLENIALTQSRNIITPHKEIAEIFNNKSIRIDWVKNEQQINTNKVGKVLFPASALARKGAYEVKQLAQELNLDLLVSGRNIEENDFWKGLKVQSANSSLDGVKLVIYPAYIEHQPRILLRALAKGIPVIATETCGLPPQENLVIVPTGDYNALKKAVQFLVV